MFSMEDALESPNRFGHLMSMAVALVIGVFFLFYFFMGSIIFGIRLGMRALLCLTNPSCIVRTLERMFV
jgi:hypothetical protein